MELYAEGEGGRRVGYSIPWRGLVGPNTGLLEALYQNRAALPRPLDVGDVVRVPGAGRYVVLTRGWGVLDDTWAPPLGPDRRPTPDDGWKLPGRGLVLQPAALDNPLHVPRPVTPQPVPRKPRKGPGPPLADAARRLRRKKR